LSKLKGKKVSESALTSYQLMMPEDANVLGNVFGGAIVRYMDMISAAVAFRHARRNVVTASIDRMNFWAPVYVGNLLILKASVNYVGRTSMEVGVRIETENLLTGKSTVTGSCYLTYVALDKRGRPTTIPAVIPVTKEEKMRYRQAMTRRKLREDERAALKSA
jgi:acyl-CoA hydrolase